MNSLTRFDQNGLELLIDTETGESFASISASARIVERNKSTISAFIGVRNWNLKNAEISTLSGIQGVRLLNEEQLIELVAHYAPEKLILFAKAGIRMYLHQLAGYEVKSTTVERPKLPPYEEAVRIADSIRHITDNLEDNPRLAQLLIDHAVNEILEQKQLPGSEPQLRGVVEIASDMGFKTDMSSRVKLGQFVKAQLPNLAKSESRLCNGMTRQINCYPDTEKVREVIAKFFS